MSKAREQQRVHDVIVREMWKRGADGGNSYSWAAAKIVRLQCKVKKLEAEIAHHWAERVLSDFYEEARKVKRLEAELRCQRERELAEAEENLRHGRE